MSRRSKKGNEREIIIIIGVIMILYIAYVIIKTVVEFIQENSMYFIIIGIILILIACGYYGYKLWKKLKNKKAYENSPYYQETELPFKVINNNAGLLFEIEIFNKLKEIFPNSKVLTNLLIPRIGSVNEYSEIDIIFLHETGFYALELKNYTGYVYGNMNDQYWNVGYKNENQRNVYEFLNPMMQNEKHIEDLEKITSFKFINNVIFNTTTEIDSNIPNVSYFDAFVRSVKTKEQIYTSIEVKEVMNKIKSINVYEKLDKHIERIKFNEKKYSGYKKKK